MNEESCSLVYTGRILEGMSFERVHQNLAVIYKADVEKIKQKFSNKRTVIKRDTDRATCRKIQQRLLEAGAICNIVTGEGAEEPPQVSGQESQVPEAEAEAAVNPYAPPRSNLKVGALDPSGNFTAPRKRPASSGAAWFFQAVSLFLKSPLIWILTMLCFFLVSLVQIVPIIGPIALTLLSPVFLAGLIIGAKGLSEKNELRVGCLFQGFQQGFGQLVLLGVIFLAAVVIGGALTAAVMFGLVGLNASAAGGPPVAAFLVAPLFFLAIFVPVMMGYWFSPALIAINEKPVFEAISLSFRACLKNILPFLVYSLVAAGIMIGLMVVFGIVAGLLGAGLAGNNLLLAGFLPFLLMLPVMLALGPIYLSSIYTSYKDIFYSS
jgi:hypothetical protein